MESGLRKVSVLVWYRSLTLLFRCWHQTLSLVRNMATWTQIQFFRDRLQSDKIGLLLFPVLVGLVIPYLLIGVMSAGTVIQAVTAGAFPRPLPIPKAVSHLHSEPR